MAIRLVGNRGARESHYTGSREFLHTDQPDATRDSTERFCRDFANKQTYIQVVSEGCIRCSYWQDHKAGIHMPDRLRATILGNDKGHVQVI
jgi:hypothetical protein